MKSNTPYDVAQMKFRAKTISGQWPRWRQILLAGPSSNDGPVTCHFSHKEFPILLMVTPDTRIASRMETIV